MTHSDLLKILNHSDALTEEEATNLIDLPGCKIIQGLIQERYRVSISLAECEQLWKRFSNQQDAQWLNPESCTAQEICCAAIPWARSHFRNQ